jgi:hypothetical protein
MKTQDAIITHLFRENCFGHCSYGNAKYIIYKNLGGHLNMQRQMLIMLNQEPGLWHALI